jgi:hypothetical protein
MELVTYRSFTESDRAMAMGEILRANEIPHTITEDRESLDSLYGDKQYRRHYFVKIRKEDFHTVDVILLKHSSQFLDTVDHEHYLFTFSNEELYDILAKPDEWNEFDYLLAQRILDNRGEKVDISVIEKLRSDRIKELAKPDEKGQQWIAIGYIFAFFGGVLGIIIGWHLQSFRKTLPDGNQVYAFNANDRMHGFRILVLGIVMMIFWIGYGIIRKEY